jgi:hypothetical protein
MPLEIKVILLSGVVLAILQLIKDRRDIEKNDSKN